MGVIGSVSVTVTPDARGFPSKLKADLAKSLQDLKVTIVPDVPADTPEKLGLKGKESGDKFAGEFDRTVKTKIDAALKALPAANIKADSTEAERKIQSLRSSLERLSGDAKLGISDDAALIRIRNLKTELDKLGASSASPSVRLDAGAAAAQLAAIQAGLTKLDHTTANPKVDSSSLDKANGGFLGFFSNLGLIPALALPATAALIPLVGVIGALTAAVAAPALIAGGALGIFGILGAQAVTQTNKQLKLISTTSTALDKLTQGTAAYAAKAKELKDLQGGLSTQAVQYQKSLANVKGAFDQLLQGKTGTALLGTVAKGLNLVAKVLPGLAPLILSVGGAISSLIDDASKAVSGKGFTSFIHDFAKTVGPDIKIIAHILGNSASGLTGLLFGLNDAFNAKGGGPLHGLLELSKGFKRLGQQSGDSKWLREFVDYFHSVGPQVADTAGALAKSLGHIVEALAPLGPPVLKTIQGIADAFNAIPIPVLTALATAFVAMTGGGKIAGALKGLGGKGAVEKVGGGAAALGAGALGGGAAAAAVGVAALAAAFAALYQNSKPVRHIVHDLGDYFQSKLAPAIARAAHGAIPDLNSSFHGFSRTIRQNQGLITEFGKVLLTIGAANVVSNLHLIGGAIRVIAAGFRIGVGAAHVWVDVILTGARFIVKAFGLLLNTVLRVFGDIVHGAAVAFGWLPGVGGKLKKADAAFQGFRAQASGALDGVAAHIQALQGKLDAVARPRKVTVTADTRAAIANLQRLQALQIKDKSFTVTQIERVVGVGGGIGRPHADGGLLRGPGGPRDDVLPIWASNGEYVVKAAAVAKYGVHMFDRLNAMHFADGGRVNTAPALLDSRADREERELRELRFEARLLKDALHKMKSEIAKVTDTLTKERAQRDKLVQARSALVSQTQDKFRSDLFGQTVTTPGSAAIAGTPAGDHVDPFSTSFLPTAATADIPAGADVTTTTNPLDILRADVAHSQQFQATLKQLEALGLHGGAETALAQSADPLAAAQQLLALGAGQVQQYQSLYAQRQQITHETGAYVGDQRFGDAIAEEKKEIQKTNAHLRDVKDRLKLIQDAVNQSSKDIGDEINGAAHHARRKAQVRQS